MHAMFPPFLSFLISFSHVLACGAGRVGANTQGCPPPIAQGRSSLPTGQGRVQEVGFWPPVWEASSAGGFNIRFPQLHLHSRCFADCHTIKLE